MHCLQLRMSAWLCDSSSRPRWGLPCIRRTKRILPRGLSYLLNGEFRPFKKAIGRSWPSVQTATARSQITERIEASKQDLPSALHAHESENVYGPHEHHDSLFPLSLGTRLQESRRLDFDEVMWEKHRSVRRYFRTMRTLPSSRTLRALTGPTIWVGGVSVALGVYEDALTGSHLPLVLPHLAPESLAPLSLSGFALALLLVFRTNTTYMRWLDARKMWGVLTSRSRDVMRQAVAWFERGEGDQELLDSLGRWTVALSRTLKTRLHFQEKHGLDAKLCSLLDAEGLALLERSSHRPSLCLQVMTGLIHKAQLSSVRVARMDDNLSVMEDIVAGCERIVKTPIPLSYTRHTTRFLIIWATALPIGLWYQLHWRTPPVVMVITALLLGIEEIGLQLEEPFSILPLETFCDSIQADVTELAKLRGKMQEYLSKL